MKEKILFYRADDSQAERVIIMERGYYRKPDGWFDTKPEAIEHFMKALSVAKAKAEVILRELKALEQKLGFEVSFQITGEDQHGIDGYQYISVKVDDYEIPFRIED